jgi:hypothetical protein
LGYEFEQCSSTLPSEQIIVIRERYQRFIIELIDQTQFRLPENVEILLLMHGTVQTKHRDGPPESVSFAIHEYVKFLEKAVEFLWTFLASTVKFLFLQNGNAGEGQMFIICNIALKLNSIHQTAALTLPTSYCYLSVTSISVTARKIRTKNV